MAGSDGERQENTVVSAAEGDIRLTCQDHQNCQPAQLPHQMAEANFSEVPLTEGIQVKVPKRILHFSDGILEDYGTDEEEEGVASTQDKRPLVDPKTLQWIPYLWHMTWAAGTRTLAVCDYLGESLASFFGITSPKYQYEIDEYHRTVQEEEEAKKREHDENAGWSPKAEADRDIQLKDIKVDPSQSTPPASHVHAVPQANSPKWERF